MKWLIRVINDLIILNKSLPSPWLSVEHNHTSTKFQSAPLIGFDAALLKVSRKWRPICFVANSAKFRPTKHNVHVVIS
jgi:hypothetical protein